MDFNLTPAYNKAEGERSMEEDARYRLLWQLCKHSEEFRADIDALEHREWLFGLPWPFIHVAVETSDVSILNKKLQPHQIKTYRDGVIRVAEKYHLPSDWGPEAIHKWAVSMFMGFAASPPGQAAVAVEISRLQDTPFIELHMMIPSFATWDDIEKVLNSHRKEIMAALKKERPHYLLDRYLMLLAWRLAGAGHKEIRKRYEIWIKEDMHRRYHFRSYPDQVPERETIKRGIRRAAKAAGIDLGTVRRTPSNLP